MHHHSFCRCFHIDFCEYLIREYRRGRQVHTSVSSSMRRTDICLKSTARTSVIRDAPCAPCFSFIVHTDRVRRCTLPTFPLPFYPVWLFFLFFPPRPFGLHIALCTRSHPPFWGPVSAHLPLSRSFDIVHTRRVHVRIDIGFSLPSSLYTISFPGAPFRAASPSLIISLFAPPRAHLLTFDFSEAKRCLWLYWSFFSHFHASVTFQNIRGFLMMWLVIRSFLLHIPNRYNKIGMIT